MTTSVVMLAGGLRSGAFRTQLGFPTAGMPLEPDCTLLQAWLGLVAKTPALADSELVIACNNERDRDWFAAESRRIMSETRVPRVLVDPRPHRGVAGMLADLKAEATDATSMLVIELNSLPPTRLDTLVALDETTSEVRGETADTTPSMRVGVGIEDRWAGVYCFDTDLLRHVTSLGYVDLKEQFVPQLLAKGYPVRAVEFGDTAVQISDRRNYLRAVRIWRARQGFVAERSEQVSGFSVVCPGAHLGSGVHVADSAVLPGAVLGDGAVVARSVIGPMIQVPAGAVIVDALLADPDAVSIASDGRRPVSVGHPEQPVSPHVSNTAIPWSVQS